jgi:hypothetical protein
MNSINNKNRIETRKREIAEITNDLNSIKHLANFEDATEINLQFVRACRSRTTFLWWLLTHAARIRKQKDQILELADLPFPKWQKEIHLKFIQTERQKFIDLLRSIRTEILASLDVINSEPVTLLSIGCAGMELERQLIEKLIRSGSSKRIIFIGVELNPTMAEIAPTNLAPLIDKSRLQFRTLSILDGTTLDDLKECSISSQYVVALLNANVFTLLEYLPAQTFDIAYHSMMKHHLTPDEKITLDEFLEKIATKVVEYDSLWSFPAVIAASIFTWRRPSFLAATILSQFRGYTKKDLVSQPQGWKCKFNKFGYYLRTYEIK